MFSGLSENTSAQHFFFTRALLLVWGRCSEEWFNLASRKLLRTWNNVIMQSLDTSQLTDWGSVLITSVLSLTEIPCKLSPGGERIGFIFISHSCGWANYDSVCVNGLVMGCCFFMGCVCEFEFLDSGLVLCMRMQKAGPSSLECDVCVLMCIHLPYVCTVNVVLWFTSLNFVCVFVHWSKPGAELANAKPRNFQN